MKVSKTRNQLLLMAAGASSLAGSAQAFDAMDMLAYKIGPVMLRPKLSVLQSYNDNIYYNAGSEKVGDAITSIRPSLEITLGRKEAVSPWFNLYEAGENFFTLDYEYDQFWYWTQSQTDYHDQIISIRNQLKGNRLSLQGSDQFQFLDSVVGGYMNQGIYGSQANVSRITFNDSYTLSYRISDKSGVYGNFAFNATYYEQTVNLYDDNTLRGTLGFDYKALPITSFFGEAYYGQTASSPNSPYLPSTPYTEFLGGFIGARGNFLSRFSGSVKVGYEHYQFANTPYATDTPVANATISYAFTQRINTQLTYVRQNNISSQYAFYVYTLNSFGLSVQYRMGSMGQILTSAGLTYGLYNYPLTLDPIERQDTSFGANVNIAYMIQAWMSVFLRYDFDKFGSSAKGMIDYDVNRVTLGLTIGY